MTEILVASTWGVPADCVVSIRCGGVRRQAPLDVAAKQVLKFPVGRDALNEPLKIDVLRPVATARLVIHPHEDEYSIGFLDNDNMEIGLNIKPGEPGKTASVGKESRPTSAKSAIGKLEAATSAREYLETHGVLRYVQGLLHALIQLRPEDPFLFMMEQLSARRNPEVRSRLTSRPTSPAPPGNKPAAEPLPPPVPPAPLPATRPWMMAGANSEASTNRDTTRSVPEDTGIQTAPVSDVAAQLASLRDEVKALRAENAAQRDEMHALRAQSNLEDSAPVASARPASPNQVSGAAGPASEDAAKASEVMAAADSKRPAATSIEPASMPAARDNSAASAPSPESTNAAAARMGSADSAAAMPEVQDVVPLENGSRTDAEAALACPVDARRTSSTVTSMIYAMCSQATACSPESGNSAASASASMASPNPERPETFSEAVVSDKVVASSPAATSSAPGPAAARTDPASASAALPDVVQEQPDVRWQAESALDNDMEADELQTLPNAEHFGDLMARARESLHGAAESGKLDGKLAEVFLPAMPQVPERSPAFEEVAAQPTRCASDSVLVKASSDGIGTNVRVLQVELDHLTEESRALHGEVDRLNTEMMTLMETNQALLRQCGLDDAVNGVDLENQVQQQ